MPVEELASKGVGVVVATLVSVGRPDMGPLGASDYSSQWKVIKVVQGQYVAEEKMSFRVQSLPEKHRERMPEVGKTYILMAYDINSHQIAWVFDYTDRKLSEIETIVKQATATQPAPQPGTIPFSTHNGYFVSNTFEPDKAESFVVLKDQKAFHEVFGVAMVDAMPDIGNKSHRLPADAFDKKWVLAVIKRGKATWQYTVKEVVEDKGVLTVRYTTTATKSDSAEFACPLIVSVPKGDYTAVEFMEEGKSVKKMEIPAK